MAMFKYGSVDQKMLLFPFSDEVGKELVRSDFIVLSICLL